MLWAGRLSVVGRTNLLSAFYAVYLLMFGVCVRGLSVLDMN